MPTAAKPTARTGRVKRAPVVRRAPPARAIVQHNLWSEGLYVAPWLNAYDGLSILAIDHDQRLAGVLEVTAGDARYDAYLYLRKEEISTELSFDDTALFSDAGLVKSIGAFWAPGVHRPPWLPRTVSVSNGSNLIVIAPESRYWDLLESHDKDVDLEAEAWKSFDRSCEDSPSVAVGYDYGAFEAIRADKIDRLRRVKEQYKEDRAEYGRLIELGAAAKAAAQ